MDKISVVVTNYNNGALLRRAVDSLRKQADRDFETVVVDDGSSDVESKAVCRELVKSGAKVIELKNNMGVSFARNVVTEAAEGEICVPLDSDDVLPENAVADIRDCFRMDPAANFAFGNYIVNDEMSGTKYAVDSSILCNAKGYADPYQQYKHCLLLGCSPYRKLLWKRVGGYTATHPLEDCDFWFKALKHGAKGKYINKTVYHWFKRFSGRNCRVTEGLFYQVVWHNIGLFDMTGQGIDVRRDLVQLFMRIKYYDEAKAIARELLTLGERSWEDTVLANCPGRCSAFTIGLARKYQKKGYDLTDSGGRDRIDHGGTHL